MKLSEVMSRVIAISQVVYDYYDRELPRMHPRYPIIQPQDGTVPPPPEEGKLRTFLDSLPAEQVFQLVLLMYLGREDFGTDLLQEKFEEIKLDFESAEEVVRFLMDKPSLAEYLSDAVEFLQQQNLEVDHLPLKKRKTTRR